MVHDFDKEADLSRQTPAAQHHMGREQRHRVGAFRITHPPDVGLGVGIDRRADSDARRVVGVR